MDYKDTILTQQEFKEADKIGNWKDDYNPILDKQAQKSFEQGRKLGMKEVAEWFIESELLDDFFDLRDQFKEWGVTKK